MASHSPELAESNRLRRGDLREQRDDMHLDRAPFAHRVDLLVSLAFEIHARDVHAEQSRDVGDHLTLLRSQFRALTDHGDVEIDQRKALVLEGSARRLHERRGVFAFPFRCAVRKRLADIFHPESAQQRINHRVIDGVAVRMRDGTDGMIKVHPRENKRATASVRSGRLEPVKVVAVADPKHGERGRHRFIVSQTSRLCSRNPKRDGGVGRYLLYAALLRGRRTRRPSTMNRTTTFALVAVSGMLTLAGCYGPRGAAYPYSGNGYTYVSTEMNPVTITLYDTRNEEPFFKLDVPVGKQLTLNFLEGKGDDPVERPDRMVYSIWNAGTSTGRLTNQLTCPGIGCRRISYDIRAAPEWREEPPEMINRVESMKNKPAWWTPQGGELPQQNKYYE